MFQCFALTEKQQSASWSGLWIKANKEFFCLKLLSKAGLLEFIHVGNGIFDRLTKSGSGLELVKRLSFMILMDGRLIQRNIECLLKANATKKNPLKPILETAGKVELD